VTQSGTIMEFSTRIHRFSDDIDDATYTDEFEPATPNTSALTLSERFNLAMLKNGTASPKNENGTKELIKIIKIMFEVSI